MITRILALAVLAQSVISPGRGSGALAASAPLSPVFVATVPLVRATAAATITTASYHCLSGDTLFLFTSALHGASTLTYSTTTTNTVSAAVPVQSNGTFNGVAMAQVFCNGSTGTYTVTDTAALEGNIGLTGFEYSGLPTGLDGSNWNWCATASSVTSTPSCAVTPSAAGGIIAAYVYSTNSGVAQNPVTGWTVEQNVASSSYYDATAVSGVNTFPSVTQGTNDFAQVLVVSLR